ncbi:transposase [Anaeromyxobacter sp. Fw109-5]|uniref:transposase n=1 Tax=Anaeromyxobacter sp. (strain Fw109-5) TaxID=404589 RepID=UPI0000ED8A4A|nr:transposase [Anaeromyxobacter sp. Fw109-5]ABS27471.1 transposase, IS630 family [Anaeromyxobacter sp. Fw109-5]
MKAARRFAEFGEAGLVDQRAFNGARKVDARFVKEELERVLLSVPTEFGWQRTTWTRELLGRELERHRLPRVAACTMGRALCAIGARLGMPKPTVACPWDSARRKRVLARLRRLARTATAAEPVFFEDEMDVHLNPKIGRDWMPRGHRRYVLTPGQNKKRFVAGALNATTGKVAWVDAPSKASELFHKLVWKLLGEYRRVGSPSLTSSRTTGRSLTRGGTCTSTRSPSAARFTTRARCSVTRMAGWRSSRRHRSDWETGSF